MGQCPFLGPEDQEAWFSLHPAIKNHSQFFWDARFWKTACGS